VIEWEMLSNGGVTLDKYVAILSLRARKVFVELLDREQETYQKLALRVYIGSFGQIIR
jgi:hypothetical protein